LAHIIGAVLLRQLTHRSFQVPSDGKLGLIPFAYCMPPASCTALIAPAWGFITTCILH